MALAEEARLVPQRADGKDRGQELLLSAVDGTQKIVQGEACPHYLALSNREGFKIEKDSELGRRKMAGLS